VGSYIVCGYSDQYYPGECRTYTIAAGPDGGNIGDYALKSFPVRFSELTTCNISSQTSTCKYSVRLSNGSAQSIDNGALWSIINVWDPVAGTSTFQSGKQTVSMRPSGTGTNSSKVLWFDYVVPGTVSEGTYMCPIFFYGQDPVNPYFKVIGSQNYNYNCIIKQGGVFKAMPANKSQLSPGAEAYKRAIEQKHGVKAIPPELPK
jgi:hypothetical protein